MFGSAGRTKVCFFLFLLFFMEAGAAGPQESSARTCGAREVASPASAGTVFSFVPGEVLVTFRNGETDGKVRDLVEFSGAESTKIFEGLSRETGKTFALFASRNMTTEDLLSAFSRDPAVESVSPNFLRKTLSVVPNDPYFKEQWGLSNPGVEGGASGADIDAPGGWVTRTSCLPSKVVAVIDGGIQRDHEDLAPNLWSGPGGIIGFDFVRDDSDPDDEHGHGTHVAGIIGAVGNNGRGTTGVAWEVRLMILKTGDKEGVHTMDRLLEAYIWILDRKREGVDIAVVNTSMGGAEFIQAERDALSAFAARGILVVAAAGNDGSDNDSSPVYPASYSLPNIISVTATDRSDNLAWFSNYGSSVHVAAPGEDILSTWLPGAPAGAGDSQEQSALYTSGYAGMSGTSAAAPFVTGVAALACSQFPGESMNQVRGRILQGVDVLESLRGKIASGGRVNLHRTLDPSAPEREPNSTAGGCSAGGSLSMAALLAAPLLLAVFGK